MWRAQRVFVALAVVAGAAAPTAVAAQERTAPGVAAASAVAAPPAVAPVPDDYLIGPDDVLGVVFWREPDMSGDVTVRPDGKITLPLIGEVKAVGLKPEALREQLQASAGRYLTEVNVNVVVRQIHSRQVFITGEVAKPGAYPLTGPHTVLQLIAVAGGLTEYAQGEKITLMRNETGRTRVLRFDYKKVSKGIKLDQNVQLQPGDTVVVP